MKTSNPFVAMAWLRAGRSVHISAMNLADTLRHVRALAKLEERNAA